MSNMKITIEISEDEIAEAVKERVVANAVKEIEEGLNDSKLGRRYRQVYVDAIVYGVRYLLKDHLDEISDKAAKAAAVSIANKGIKKLMAQLTEETTKGSTE